MAGRHPRAKACGMTRETAARTRPLSFAAGCCAGDRASVDEFVADREGRAVYLTRYTLTLTRSVSEDATHVLAYASG